MSNSRQSPRPSSPSPPPLPSFDGGPELIAPSQTRSNTTVAFWMRGSDLLPGGWERMDERRINRGDTGAVGRVAAGGKGADAPVVDAGAGGGIGGSVS